MDFNLICFFIDIEIKKGIKMNRNTRKTSNRKVEKNSNKNMRCKLKMIVIFESDKCKDFSKKDGSISGNVCKNCKYSF